MKIRKYGIVNYTINEDGSIDVDGNVNLSYKKLTKLPLKFRNVTGYFDCSYNQLTSLEGCPKSVGGYFVCRNNQLTSLEGSPKKVGGDFYCDNNQLTSLEGCPKSVGGDFDCDKYLKADYKKINRRQNLEDFFLELITPKNDEELRNFNDVVVSYIIKINKIKSCSDEQLMDMIDDELSYLNLKIDRI